MAYPYSTPFLLQTVRETLKHAEKVSDLVWRCAINIRPRREDFNQENPDFSMGNSLKMESPKGGNRWEIEM
jgi:hypothetical protein